VDGPEYFHQLLNRFREKRESPPLAPGL
jgi:hypothetical protein